MTTETTEQKFYLHIPSGVILTPEQFEIQCKRSFDYENDPLFYRAYGMPAQEILDDPFVTVSIDQTKSVRDDDARTITVSYTLVTMSELQQVSNFEYLLSYIAENSANQVAAASTSPFEIVLTKDIDADDEDIKVYSVVSDIHALLYSLHMGQIIRDIEALERLRNGGTCYSTYLNSISLDLNNQVSGNDNDYGNVVQDIPDTIQAEKLSAYIEVQLECAQIPVTLQDLSTQAHIIHVFSGADLFNLLNLHTRHITEKKYELIKTWYYLHDESIPFVDRYRCAAEVSSHSCFGGKSLGETILAKHIEATVGQN